MKIVALVLLLLLYFNVLCLGGDGDSAVYDPSKSKTYDKRFVEYFYYKTETETYLGGSSFTGYDCKDRLALGPSGGSTASSIISFLCIAENAEYLPFDGIMGMGPDSHVLSSLVPSKKFSIFIGPTVGEVQLGGYIPSSTLNSQPVNYYTLEKGRNYGYHVTIDQIKITDGTSNSAIVYSKPPIYDVISYPLETIADSGTGRLMLPTMVSSSLGTISLYDSLTGWMNNHTQTDIFVVSFMIGGIEYEIYAQPGTFGRLQGAYASTLILGQPFFYYNLVSHDLSNASDPKIGFATKNQHYIPNMIQNYEGVTTLPLNTTARDALTYFFTIQVGTPPVSLRVLLDTGSGDLLVASTAHFAIPLWVYGVCTLFILIVMICTLRYMCCNKNKNKNKNKKGYYVSEQDQNGQNVRLLGEENL